MLQPPGASSPKCSSPVTKKMKPNKKTYLSCTFHNRSFRYGPMPARVQRLLLWLTKPSDYIVKPTTPYKKNHTDRTGLVTFCFAQSCAMSCRSTNLNTVDWRHVQLARDGEVASKRLHDRKPRTFSETFCRKRLAKVYIWNHHELSLQLLQGWVIRLHYKYNPF